MIDDYEKQEICDFLSEKACKDDSASHKQHY